MQITTCKGQSSDEVLQTHYITIWHTNTFCG